MEEVRFQCTLQSPNIVYVYLGDEEKLSYFAKLAHKNDNVREQLCSRTYFEREVTLYKNFFPCFQTFLRTKNVQASSLFPNCYRTSLKPKCEYLLLQNLEDVGYAVYENQGNLMDIPHVRKVLEAYARFHALSLAVKKWDEDQWSNLITKIPDFFEKIYWEKEFYNVITNQCVKVETYFGENGRDAQANYIRKFRDNVHKYFLGSTTAGNSNYFVLTHGDARLANMMFEHRVSKK